MSDPKAVILNIIDTVSVTKDDDITPASILYMYEGSPELLKYLFYTQDFDIVVTIAEPRERPQREIQDVAVEYPMAYPLHVTAVDKFDAVTEFLVCTAVKAQNKMRDALFARIELNAQNANFTLKIQTVTPNTRRLGGIDRVWVREYTVEYNYVP